MGREKSCSEMKRSLDLLLVLLACAEALHLQATTPRSSLRSSGACRGTCCMGLFDSLGKAFENDDTLGARSSAGLSKEKAKRTITWKSPSGAVKKSVIVPGQRLKDVARATGVPIKYDCQEGTCKTCEAKLGGSRVKICVARAPDKDCVIQYNLR